MPYAAVNDIQGTINHEHGEHALFAPTYFPHSQNELVLARNMIEQVDHPACGPLKLVNHPVKYSRAEPKIRSPPPLLGQHTDEVLKELLELSDEEISDLKEKKTIA